MLCGQVDSALFSHGYAYWSLGFDPSQYPTAFLSLASKVHFLYFCFVFFFRLLVRPIEMRDPTGATLWNRIGGVGSSN